MTLTRRLTALILALLLLSAHAMAAEAVSQVSMRNENGTITKNVQVRYLGSIQTVIREGGQEKTIPSSRLIWDRTAPLDKHFAYIYYTKKTTVNMRLTERPRSAIVTKAAVGKIVLVSEIGEKYSKVIYGTDSGWLPTSVLRFLAPMETAPSAAKISYKGAVTGTHNYTTRKKENDYLVSIGWREEGIGWYGVAQE